MAKGTNNEEQIQTTTAGAKQKAKQEGLSLANELLQRNSRKRPAPTTPDTATEPPPAKKSELEGLLLGLLEQNKVNTNPNPNPNPNNLTTTPPTAKRNLQRQGINKKRPRRQRQRKRPPLKHRKLNRLKTKTYHKRIYKTKHRKLLNNIYKNNINHAIVNLSSHNLTNTEISVLTKGLTFIPKPKHTDREDILNGIMSLNRQLSI